jgi:uroporphyrinogen decarboxylase
LIDLLTRAVVSHLDAQIRAGVEAVQIFDSWAAAAGADGLGPFVIEPVRRIVAELRTRWPSVPIIGFPKGITKLETYVSGTGVDMISIDSSVALDFARDRLQELGAVQGNLDPALLVAGGPAMRTGIEGIVSALGRGGFVFNLGHGVVPQTPPEHVAELAAILRALPVA